MDVEAECLGSFEVEDQLEFGRKQHRKISRFCAFKNPAGVSTSLAIHINDVGTVADEAAGSNKTSQVIDRRDCTARRYFDDWTRPGAEERIVVDNSRIDVTLSECRKCRLKIGLADGVDDQNIKADAGTFGLQNLDFSFSVRIARVNKHADDCRFRHKFAHQFHSFRRKGAIEKSQSCGVAARPIDCRDKPKLDRVSSIRKDDRNRLSRGLSGLRGVGAAGSYNHGDLAAHQIRSHRRQLAIMTVGKSVFYLDGLTFDVAELT